MSQRHSNYYGFVKTGSAKVSVSLMLFSAFWRPLVDLLRHFGAHWILKGVPKSTIFETKIEKNLNKRVQEAAMKTHDLLIDF